MRGQLCTRRVEMTTPPFVTIFAISFLVCEDFFDSEILCKRRGCKHICTACTPHLARTRDLSHERVFGSRLFCVSKNIVHPHLMATSLLSSQQSTPSLTSSTSPFHSTSLLLCPAQRHLCSIGPLADMAAPAGCEPNAQRVH